MNVISKILDGEIDPGVVAEDPIATKADIPDPEMYDKDIAFIVQTSGSSTGKPTPIPVLEQELDHHRNIGADGFALNGLTEDDVLLSGGAMLPHYSGWVIREGSRALGAEVLNWGRPDADTVVDWKEAEDVTALTTLPEVARVMGDELEEEYGEPARDLFPNMRIGLLSGDHVTDRNRTELKEQWGFDEVREFYSAVDTNVLAAAVDETRELVPLVNHFVFEVQPTDSDELIPIQDVDEELSGTLYVSDPARDTLPNRYELDTIQVYPDERLSRIEVLGRPNDTINLSGAILHEAEIHAAVDDTYDAVDDVIAYVSPDALPSVQFYLVGADPTEPDFLYNLFKRNPPVGEAFAFGRDLELDEEAGTVSYTDTGQGLIDYLSVEHCQHIDDVPDHVLAKRADNPIKAQTIVFKSG